MSGDRSPLQKLRVASPCPADWSEMEGNARVRFCGECRLNVYNLSEMSAGEAEALIRGSEGRLCVRFYQRTDGKVMTRDCPRGVLAARIKLGRAIAIAAALTGSAFGIAIQREIAKTEEMSWADKMVDRGVNLPVVGPAIQKVFPQATTGDAVVGAIYVPPGPTFKGP